jgi:hypothetical protein
MSVAIKYRNPRHPDEVGLVIIDEAVQVEDRQKIFVAMIDRAESLRRLIALYRQYIAGGVNAELARQYLDEIALAEAEPAVPGKATLGRLRLQQRNFALNIATSGVVSISGPATTAKAAVCRLGRRTLCERRVDQCRIVRLLPGVDHRPGRALHDDGLIVDDAVAVAVCVRDLHRVGQRVQRNRAGQLRADAWSQGRIVEGTVMPGRRVLGNRRPLIRRPGRCGGRRLGRGKPDARHERARGDDRKQ